jgi:hypothetical protein
MRSEFVHLHLHSEYSFLDGAVRMRELIKKAAEFQMPAVALTDHGNLHGAIEFYQEATKSGIKPIIGCEAYMAPGSIKDRPNNLRDAAYHLTLLAKDDFNGAPGRIPLSATDRQRTTCGALDGSDRPKRLSQGRNQHGNPVG